MRVDMNPLFNWCFTRLFWESIQDIAPVPAMWPSQGCVQLVAAHFESLTLAVWGQRGVSWGVPLWYEWWDSHAQEMIFAFLASATWYCVMSQRNRVIHQDWDPVELCSRRTHIFGYWVIESNDLSIFTSRPNPPAQERSSVRLCCVGNHRTISRLCGPMQSGYLSFGARPSVLLEHFASILGLPGSIQAHVGHNIFC